MFFKDVIGQEEIKKRLIQEVNEGRIPVSYTHLDVYKRQLPDRLVCLPVKRPYAITLYGRLPIVLRAPLEASVTILEATTPVKLPTKQCPRNHGLELK